MHRMLTAWWPGPGKNKPLENYMKIFSPGKDVEKGDSLQRGEIYFLHLLPEKENLSLSSMIQELFMKASRSPLLQSR